jgi:hypothetical protein
MSRALLVSSFVCSGLSLFANLAFAQPQEPPKPDMSNPETEPDPPVPAEPTSGTASTEANTATAVLDDEMRQLETSLATAEEPRKSKPSIRLSGYGDIGAFATQGDGSGIRRDAGHTMFPEHGDVGWVFYGDLLATTINSRGDVADLGEVPGVDRFDAINSGGTPTFLVNELNLTVNASAGSRALFTSSVNFTPRSGNDFALGDSFDVDLVQLEWMPTSSGNHSIFIGKFDSVIGHEYKTRKASERFGITPSLLARYTTGTAIGIKGRSRIFNDHVILAAAVTNGSFGVEQFHFHSEVDTNAAKTISGRAAVRAELGGLEIEVGPSGQYGVQDGAGDNAGKMSVFGVDAEIKHMRFALKAQWMRGKAPGDELAMAYRLDLKQGGYLEGNLIVTPTIGLIGRAEFRDAEVQQGSERLYITKNWRATAGVRLVLGPNAVLKAEVCHNGEYGPTPAIPDDIVTTSAVMAF